MVVISLVIGMLYQERFVDDFRFRDLAQIDSTGGKVGLEQIDVRLQLVGFLIERPGLRVQSKPRIGVCGHVEVKRAVHEERLVPPQQIQGVSMTQ